MHITQVIHQDQAKHVGKAGEIAAEMLDAGLFVAEGVMLHALNPNHSPMVGLQVQQELGMSFQSSVLP